MDVILKNAEMPVISFGEEDRFLIDELSKEDGQPFAIRGLDAVVNSLTSKISRCTAEIKETSGSLNDRNFKRNKFLLGIAFAVSAVALGVLAFYVLQFVAASIVGYQLLVPFALIPPSILTATSIMSAGGVIKMGYDLLRDLNAEKLAAEQKKIQLTQVLNTLFGQMGIQKLALEAERKQLCRILNKTPEESVREGQLAATILMMDKLIPKP